VFLDRKPETGPLGVRRCAGYCTTGVFLAGQAETVTDFHVVERVLADSADTRRIWHGDAFINRKHSVSPFYVVHADDGCRRPLSGIKNSL
jgi:hypothetical protein